jgi:membrane protein
MTATSAELDPSRGRQATGPSELPWKGWLDVLWRVKSEVAADRITLIAAGATYYLLLALFPALAAFVSIYGFVADPVTIADHIAFLGGVLPSGGIELIETQLKSLASQNEAALSVGFIFGLLVALWSANSGIKTLFDALNIAYEEDEKRGFIKLNALSLLFTLGAIIVGILFIVSVGVVPAVLAFVGLGSVTELLISLLRWPIIIIVSAAAISLLYRYGPSRERAKWRWVTWGGCLAAAVWLIASILFSWYLSNFADYNATYGSLGAVIGFMLWTWISVVILLLGAELNSELEHQTARDSTTGTEKPLGHRGATMADTIGESRDSSPEKGGTHTAPQGYIASPPPKSRSPLPQPPSSTTGSGPAAERRHRSIPESEPAWLLSLAAVGTRLLLDMLHRSDPEGSATRLRQRRTEPHPRARP